MEESMVGPGVTCLVWFVRGRRVLVVSRSFVVVLPSGFTRLQTASEVRAFSIWPRGSIGCLHHTPRSNGWHTEGKDRMKLWKGVYVIIANS